MKNLKKIHIIGTSCCGKSTLAKSISENLGIKYIELDELSWLPNWQMRPNEDFFQLLEKELSENDSWVVAGNYNFDFVRDNVWKKSDVTIWLDIPKYKLLFRGVKRILKRAIYKTPCCNGNYETLKRGFFSKESILVWIWQTCDRRKKRYEKLIAENYFENSKVIRIRNNKQLKELNFQQLN